jgi:Nif-specific regulatory protein
MGNTANNIEIQNESAAKLLSTLDEGIFFVELTKSLNREIKAQEVLTYLIKDESALLITKNGRALKRRDCVSLESGVLSQVNKSKRPYFSNHVSSDPLFSKEQNRKSILIVPVAVEGVVVALIQFSNIDNEQEFNREQINLILKDLSELETPIKNLKLYLSAKFLNEALMEQLSAQSQNAPVLAEAKNEYAIEAPKMVEKSVVMSELLALSRKVAVSDASILIEGQAGTGKDRLARYIHANSSRKGFYSINCATANTRELEIELFGIEDGRNIQEGILEKLSEGTVVLRNIHSLGIDLQAKLLNLIKDRVGFRVNGTSSFTSSVRIVSTTESKLNELVEQGLFRQDLYYCLNMITLAVPTLSEREDDIDDLADEILNGNRRSDEHKSLTPGALKRLKEYQWRGNISELKATLEQAYVLSKGIMIDESHLILEAIAVEEVVEEENDDFEFEEDMTLDELERRFICATLDRLNGNKTKTAKALGITVKTLYNKLHSYDMISKEA